jgi:hypothetical protein
MSGKKLIIPAEFKVCATCSYWDGVRKFDEEIGVVVVGDCEKGECLVKSSERPGLHDVRQECDCLWEELQADPVEEAPVEEAPVDEISKERAA